MKRSVRKKRRGSQQVTIRDVARSAKVAPITASRALKSDKKVAPETRERVFQAAKELNYVPNLAAGALASNRSPMVGVIVPSISYSVFSEILQSFSHQLLRSGRQVLLGANNYSLWEEEELVKTFCAHRAEAIVLTGFTHSDATIDLIRKSDVPVVQMWNLTDNPLDTIVGSSNFDAAFAMTSYLIEKGHRRIGFIGGGVENNDRTTQREAGYRAAIERHGLVYDDSVMRRASFVSRNPFMDGGTVAADLIEAHPSLEAIFVASDMLAVGALMMCIERGIKVPEQLALAGFDGSRLAEVIQPTLTTVHLPRGALGEMVADVVLKRIDGEANGEKVIDLGFEIIPRRSA